MKLIAKKGSELEQVLKAMWEQMQATMESAKTIIREATGVEPESIGYRWGWGEILTFLPGLTRFKREDWDKVDEKIMRRDKRDDNYFKPALRYKAGQQLEQRFMTEVTDKGIDEKPLNKFGIHQYNDRASYWMQPFYDKETNQYMLICSNSAPEAFTGNAKKEGKREFEIQY